MLSATILAPLLKKLPTPLYKWLGRRWISYEWPRHVFLETTSRCNLSCSYCPRPRVSHDLPYELFEKIVDEASLYGHRSFSLHLFGEPLLYPRIIDCIRTLKIRGHSIILTTNGTMLGYFGQSLGGVDKIIWSYKKEVKVPEYFKNWRNFTVRFFERREDLSWPRWEIRKFHNYGGQVSTAPFTGVRYPCYHPFLAPAVNSRGDILICCADPNSKSSVGNIKDITIAQAWKKMTINREEHLKGIYKGICKNCNVWASYPSFF